jgi:hypothetical protein
MVLPPHVLRAAMLSRLNKNAILARRSNSIRRCLERMASINSAVSNAFHPNGIYITLLRERPDY